METSLEEELKLITRGFLRTEFKDHILVENLFMPDADCEAVRLKFELSTDFYISRISLACVKSRDEYIKMLVHHKERELRNAIIGMYFDNAKMSIVGNIIIDPNCPKDIIICHPEMAMKLKGKI